ncbi:MAG: LAGLIDADG family homing endonuclease [Planctomycetota bacterium]
MSRPLPGAPPDAPVPEFSPQALVVLEARYLHARAEGRETPAEMLWRVARNVAQAEANYDGAPEETARAFYEAMARRRFLPNSPTLGNAGRPQGQLSACFVLPIEDSLDAIFEAVKYAARIHGTGGGTGFSFSRLRPRDDLVRDYGRASGPVAFMEVFDAATGAVRQGGVRRGANMGILRVDHPDIREFVAAKRRAGALTHFNISVAVTDAFMAALSRGERYALLHPGSGEPVGELDARALWRELSEAAWATGDPGLVFIDRINALAPTPALGEIESTNPCVPGDTWVLTSDGPHQVEELIGEPCEVVLNGEVFRSETGFFATGERALLEVITREGYRLRATPDHLVQRVSKLSRYVRETEWVPVQALAAGDLLALNDHRSHRGWDGEGDEEQGYLLGLLLGDGTLQPGSAMIDVWGDGPGPEAVRAAAVAACAGPKHRADWRGFQRPRPGGTTRLKSAPLRDLAARFGMVPGSKCPDDAIERTSAAFHAGFLRGLFDTDGSVQGDRVKGISVRLAQSDRQVLELAQRMLLRLGVASTIYLERRPAGTRPLPDGRGGLAPYPVEAQHQLVVARANLAVFAEVVGFADRDEQQRLRTALEGYARALDREGFVATVREVLPAGSEAVYDIQVPGANAFDGNGFVLHNCGELPLLPYESCNLGSVNLAAHVQGGALDEVALRETIRLGVRFLDDVIDRNAFPLVQIAEVTRTTRKIGLGVMGWADLLVALGLPYASEEALALAERLGALLLATARDASRALARERGAFPAWEGSRWAREGVPGPLRNSTSTTIAPTGTISILAGCSSGIEPLYALAYRRTALDGEAELRFTLPALEERARAEGWWSSALERHVAERGSLEGAPGVPPAAQALFATAHEIAPSWHVRHQAAWQRHIENAVSKTVNLPRAASPVDVAAVYQQAWDLGCKGITIYRDGSREGQVLSHPSEVTTGLACGGPECLEPGLLE